MPLPPTYPPGERTDRYDNPPDIPRWIAPATLDRFPCGPYTVHVYRPSSRRTFTLAGQLPEDAASMAGDFAALGCDVHVTIDLDGAL